MWPFGRYQPRGVHSRQAALEWARGWFPEHLQAVAAFVAEVLCEQIGVPLSHREPATRFTADLGMDELEPVEFVMALEADLAFSIPDEDCTRLNTIADLVLYLHERISERERMS